MSDNNGSPKISYSIKEVLAKEISDIKEKVSKEIEDFKVSVSSQIDMGFKSFEKIPEEIVLLKKYLFGNPDKDKKGLKDRVEDIETNYTWIKWILGILFTTIVIKWVATELL